MAKYIKLEDALYVDCILMNEIECEDCPFCDVGRSECRMYEWLESLPTIEVNEYTDEDDSEDYDTSICAIRNCKWYNADERVCESPNDMTSKQCDYDWESKEELADKVKEKERTAYKPIRIDDFTEKCPKCGEKVMYAVGTGVMFHGASESYEDWRVIKHDYCPKCGVRIERRGNE